MFFAIAIAVLSILCNPNKIILNAAHRQSEHGRQTNQHAGKPQSLDILALSGHEGLKQVGTFDNQSREGGLPT